MLFGYIGYSTGYFGDLIQRQTERRTVARRRDATESMFTINASSRSQMFQPPPQKTMYYWRDGGYRDYPEPTPSQQATRQLTLAPPPQGQTAQPSQTVPQAQASQGAPTGYVPMSVFMEFMSRFPMATPTLTTVAPLPTTVPTSTSVSDCFHSISRAGPVDPPKAPRGSFPTMLFHPRKTVSVCFSAVSPFVFKTKPAGMDKSFTTESFQKAMLEANTDVSEGETFGAERIGRNGPFRNCSWNWVINAMGHGGVGARHSIRANGPRRLDILDEV